MCCFSKNDQHEKPTIDQLSSQQQAAKFPVDENCHEVSNDNICNDDDQSDADISNNIPKEIEIEFYEDDKLDAN